MSRCSCPPAWASRSSATAISCSLPGDSRSPPPRERPRPTSGLTPGRTRRDGRCARDGRRLQRLSGLRIRVASALAIAGGARSQLYSLVAGLCILAVLFFAGPLMAPLPWAALGAVVFYAAGKLVSIPEFRRLWRFRRREFMLAVATLVGTVLIGILQGVVLAIALSLVEM